MLCIRNILALSFVLSLPAFAEEATHLDIAVPSRTASGFFGPVKKVVTEYSYDMSERKFKEVRHYDKFGNLESRTKFDPKGKISYAATNFFNSADCLIRQRVENIREKTINDYEIVLNAPTRKIAYRCKLTGEIEVATYEENKFNSSNTIKKRGGKTLPLSRYQRTPDNKTKLYTSYNEKGRPKYVVAYEWNDQGLKARTLVTYKTEKRKDLNVYEYLSLDEHGNWTQCLHQSFDMLDNKKKKFEKFSTRTIEYYEDKGADQ